MATVQHGCSQLLATSAHARVETSKLEHAGSGIRDQSILHAAPASLTSCRLIFVPFSIRAHSRHCASGHAKAFEVAERLLSVSARRAISRGVWMAVAPSYPQTGLGQPIHHVVLARAWVARTNHAAALDSAARGGHHAWSSMHQRPRTISRSDSSWSTACRLELLRWLSQLGTCLQLASCPKGSHHAALPRSRSHRWLHGCDRRTLAWQQTPP